MRVAALLVILLQLAGCATSPLDRPAFIGASATVGFGAEVGSAEEALPVDLAVAYAALLTKSHSKPRREPLRLGDGAFFMRPAEAAAEQIDALLSERVTLIFAVDWLFWSAYAPPAEQDGVDPATLRRARVEAALAELDRTDVRASILLGTIPRLPPEGIPLVPPSSRIDAAEWSALNDRVHAWASARPRVVLLSLDDSLGPQNAPLLQSDGLHPTAGGLLRLAERSMEALTFAGVVEASVWRPGAEDAQTRLFAAAQRAHASSQPGWLEIAGAMQAWERAKRALDRKDCETATQAAERLLDIVVRLERDPTGTDFGPMLVSYLTWELLNSCPQARGTVRRAVDRLGFNVREARPNPLRLELWVELAGQLGREEEIFARLSELAPELPSTLDPYADSFDLMRGMLRRHSSYNSVTDEEIARRGRIVILHGGPDALLAYARTLLPRLTGMVRAAPSEISIIDGVPRRQPFPPSPDAADAFRALSYAVEEPRAIIRDLRAAGETAHADLLRRELGAALGEETLAMLVGADTVTSMDRLEPGWTLSNRHVIDAQAVTAALWGWPTPEHLRSVLDISNNRRYAVSAPLTITLSRRPTLAWGFLDEPTESAEGDAVHSGGDGAFGNFIRVHDELIVTRIDPHDGAIRFGEANERDRTTIMTSLSVPEWRTITLAGDVIDGIDALEAFIWRAAREAGVDVIWPFPFIVECSLDDFTATLGSSRIPISVERNLERPVRIVGLMAPGSVGRCVRPGRAAFMNVIWEDEEGVSRTGELAETGSARDVRMEVPGAAAGEHD